MSLTAILQDRGLTASVKDPGGGTMDHGCLRNRDLADQHPLAAITGLTEALEGKLPASHGDNMENPHGVTAAQVGARSDTWLPTAAEVGARPDTWLPTAAEVGARPDSWLPAPDDIGAAPAVESADYPGCFCRQVNGITEWLNPPLVLGQEYRTTERYYGKPVYVKMFSFGALPNATKKTVTYSSENCLTFAVTGTIGYTTDAVQKSTTLLGYPDVNYVLGERSAVTVGTNVNLTNYYGTICVRYTKVADY